MWDNTSWSERVWKQCAGEEEKFMCADFISAEKMFVCEEHKKNKTWEKIWGKTENIWKRPQILSVSMTLTLKQSDEVLL